MSVARHLDVPFAIGGAGRIATTTDDDHVRDMIFEVLFTNPGERVNRPDFGCGLKALVFAPASDALAAATKVLVKGSLQKWLTLEIEVDAVDVEAIENEIVVTVAYTPPGGRPAARRAVREHGLMSRRHQSPGMRGRRAAHRAARALAAVRRLQRDRLRRGRRRRPPDPARQLPQADPGRRLWAAGRPHADRDRRRHAHRRDQGRLGDRRVGLDSAHRRRSRRRLLALRADPRRPRARRGPPQYRVLVHGELPDRHRLPARAVSADRAAPSRCSTTSPRTTRASGRLMLDLLPHAATPTGSSATPPISGIALVELLAYEGDRLSLLPGRGRQRGLPRHAAHAHLGAPSRPARRLPHARRAQRVGAGLLRGQRAGVAPARDGAVHPADGAAPRGGRAAAGCSSPAGAITVDGPRARAGAARRGRVRDRPRRQPLPGQQRDRASTAGATTSAAWRPARPRPICTRSRRAAPRSAPALAAGDRLVFEELLGPRTGLAADADHAHRQLVLIESVDDGVTDPLYSDTLVGGVLVARQSGAPALPLLHVRWRRADALRAPLCLSARLADGALLRNVSVARGNVVLVDSGLTTTQTRHARRPDRRRSPRAASRPADHGVPRDRFGTDRAACSTATSARPSRRSRCASPRRPTSRTSRPCPTCWGAARSTRTSSPRSTTTGARSCASATTSTGARWATSRRSTAPTASATDGPGNVGLEAIAHAAPAIAGTPITRVRNPLPAQGGVDAETIEQVRQLAPQAFHSELFRAVTEADWVQAALRLPDVAGAVATYPLDRQLDDDLRRRRPARPGGPRRPAQRPHAAGARLRAACARVPDALPAGRLRHRAAPAALRRGSSWPSRSARAPGYFRSDVAQAVRDALSDRVLPDGSRGFFHPDHFTFGDPLYAQPALRRGRPRAGRRLAGHPQARALRAGRRR